ncbi:DUF6304 family protein [Streptomyces griseorubiginosus]|uniref:DUF6304 family protein n=1 Tax=Streptomyces griseorubiginosus TaxID=67304 RepID=UPI0011405F1D|nr:DUF6304 family protein [Streptomyces griseorubiginosus]
MTAVQLWPGRYTDRHGTEDVVFETDGRESIRTTIRGVRFEGATMGALGVVSGDPPASEFTFADGNLFACLLEWVQPVRVEVVGQAEQIARLHCALRLDHTSDDEELTAALHLDGHEFRSTQADFEYALREIARSFPHPVRLRSCISCAWSDYHPYGHGIMSDLACFRDAKNRYLLVEGKSGPHNIFDVWDRRTGFVQETWLCEQFEHRSDHQGYRGSFPG